MTKEEAARILDPETTREALAEIEYYGGFRGEEAVLEAAREARRIAAEALRHKPTGDPLTPEQLRKMDGQKVLLYRMKSTEPLEPGTVKQNGDVLGDAGMLAYHELYLETWVAFTYPPAHINMEAWRGCVCTASDKSCCTCVSLRCQFCIGESEYKQGRYCSACGRPLTEEARAELEKRLRG